MPYFLDASLSQLTANVAEQPDDVDHHIALIKRYVADGQIQFAYEQSIVANESIPGDLVVLTLQALCLANTGRRIEATEILEGLTRQNANCEYSSLLQDELLPLFTQYNSFEEGMTTEEKIQQQLDQASDEDRPLIERAHSLLPIQRAFLNRELNTVVELLAVHLDQYVDDLNAKLLLANVYMMQQENLAAKEIYDEVLKQDTNCSAAYFGLALVLDDLHDAVEASRKGLEISPGDHWERYNLGARLANIDEHEMAKLEWSRIPADDLSYSLALLGLSELAEKEDDLELAIEFARKCVSFRSDLPEYRVRLGQVLASAGSNYEALEEFETALELDSCMHLALVEKSKTLRAMGLSDQHVNSVHALLDVHPHDPTATTMLAKILHERGETATTIQLLREASEIYPNEFCLPFILGVYLYEMQQYESSIESSLRALELNPAEYGPDWNIAISYSLLGQRSDSLRHLKLAVEKNADMADKILQDEDFKAYWDDPEFLRLAQGKSQG